MSETPVGQAAPEGYRDRRVGLIVVGSLEIVFGMLCALLVPLVVLAQMMSAQVGAAATPWPQLLTALATYALLAAALVTLGIGSIRRRRWARALSLILGWSWLLVGLASMAIVALLLPSTASRLPSGGPPPLVLLAVVLVLMGCPMVLAPTVLVLFYRSRHVKATCELADPKPSWTDACPLPVLAASLWMAFGTATLLVTMASGQAAVPLFGAVLVGIPGILAALPLALLWAYLAWALYDLRPFGWWLTLACFLLLGLSAVVTFQRIDLLELYERMGYSEQQLAIVRGMPLLTGPNLAIYIAVLFLATIGYLLWIRRFFRRPPAPELG